MGGRLSHVRALDVGFSFHPAQISFTKCWVEIVYLKVLAFKDESQNVEEIENVISAQEKKKEKEKEQKKKKKKWNMKNRCWDHLN